MVKRVINPGAAVRSIPKAVSEGFGFIKSRNKPIRKVNVGDGKGGGCGKKSVK